MISITETKHRLPEKFIEELYENYSPIEVDNILIGMNQDRYTTLRVNTLKYDVQSAMRYFKEKNIKFERVPWYQDGLIIKNAKEKDIQALDIYAKGYIYLQSLSSMVPPVVLNPKAGESVLDIAAAPGSKTTQIAALMQNKGQIVANELDKIRFERLKYNLNQQGAITTKAINKRGEILGTIYEGQFDKVLLDTPCSGEGRFIAEKSATYRNWSEKTVNDLVKLQKKLLTSAYKALKQGGELVYSTCTINKHENEEVVDFGINQLGLKLVNIDLEIKDAIKIKGKAIKILPSKTYEGFFIAKFIKDERV